MTIMLSLTSFMCVLPLSYFTWAWSTSSSLQLPLKPHNSTMSLIFMMTVLIVTMSVLSFSILYMSHSTNPMNFIMFTLLFVMSMLILLTANDWLSIMIAWEGLGMTSFYLVSFYSSWTAQEGSIITMLTNRVGDITLLSATSFMLLTNINAENMLPSILLCLTLTMMTKSAQFPAMSWLPAAMAAPTPISSLVHSSTLVTAGIILWLKLSWMPLSSQIALILGSLTLACGGWAAIMEKDFKRIVAFSTLSQLGLILLSTSLTLASLSWFHLTIHAFFKSALFMWVGSMIFSAESNQNTSLFASNSNYSLTWMSWAGITLMSLSAMPMTSGFFSKESFSTIIMSSMILYYISMTTIYSWRLFKTTNQPKKVTKSMTTPSLFPSSTLSFLIMSGFLWSMNINETTTTLLTWMLLLMSIPMWVWMNKIFSKTFFKITNTIKWTMSFHKINEKWLYLWGWKATQTKMLYFSMITAMAIIL